ncbi:hypothetical protein CAL26_21260 [Bordetella genomosp. 9]|uniref:Uncharacterized protein n=1 Tax=Bordetella genomosp. 9 TaxID=1416803 RepID=A0A261R4Z4_9BORD|nr:hypothetical protein [Bordetella genomosp. 9]OZI20086.1 hypothetical protein CAL26_21260 [Bordetella genomosp. 9]
MNPPILTQAQAEAVYSAMCALNNVGGMIGATLGEAHIAEFPSGRIEVWRSADAREMYSGQTDFAAAYGLD